MDGMGMTLGLTTHTIPNLTRASGCRLPLSLREALNPPMDATAGGEKTVTTDQRTRGGWGNRIDLLNIYYRFYLVIYVYIYIYGIFFWGGTYVIHIIFLGNICFVYTSLFKNPIQTLVGRICWDISFGIHVVD